MKKSILSCLFMMLSIALFAQDDYKAQFDLGNKAYAEKEYQQAIQHYLSVLGQKQESPELFYNLGNAYYQTNEVGLSVLNYEKALKLAPDDEDIQFNLKMANLKVADRNVEPVNLFFLSGFKSMLINYASDRWAKLFLVFLWIAFVLFSAFLFLNKAALKRLSFTLGILLVFVSLVFLTFSIHQYNYQKSKKSAIVMVTNTYVKSRPDTESTDLFILREGVKVKVLDKVDDWLKVRFSEEKVGWIESDKLGLI